MSDIYSPEDMQRKLAESREKTEELRKKGDALMAPYRQRSAYYEGLRNKYPSVPGLQAEDYRFLDEFLGYQDDQVFDKSLYFINDIKPVFEAAPDPTVERDRIISAAAFSKALNMELGTAYLNLDTLTEQWTGASWTPANGLKAVTDSFQVGMLGQKHNILAIQYHNNGKDPEILKELEEVERQIEGLQDRMPKVWQQDYVRRGGWADVEQFVRSVTTGAAENLPFIAVTAGAAALASTGVGAMVSAAGLSSWWAGMLVAGATTAATAAASYGSTVGTEYRDLLKQGLPDDIAWKTANVSSLIQGAIEVIPWGVTGSIMKGFIRNAAIKSSADFFIKGKTHLFARAALEWLKSLPSEGLEEGLQTFTSDTAYNLAVREANRREEKARQFFNELMDGTRSELEKELENQPGLKEKSSDEIWADVKEAAWGGFATALILGVSGAASNYQADRKAAAKVAGLAKNATNEAEFAESVNKAEEEGYELSALKGLKTDERAEVLSEVYKAQQERLTPEQREAKQKAAQDAAALSEVTDYRNAETVQTVVDEETGETVTELATPGTSDIFREDGRLETNEYTDTNEDGSTSGRFVAGDPRIEDTEQSGINQYGYINYTETNDAVTIDEFRMLSGYENLRPDLYRQFAERFAGKNIQWAPRNEQNNSIKDQIVNANPRGPKEGLNYYERGSDPQVSAEARQTAERFRPYLKNSTPLETALAVETFGEFYRHRGESLNGAMDRLLGRVTNEAPGSVMAAQSEGRVVKGATWLEETAEGMKRVVYVNKNAADSSTVVHEISHAVAADFTDTERDIAARALDGYRLKNGTAVTFEEGAGPWTDDQHEAFAEALENYLTNGTAPNEEVKGLFERIKDFMKRIYRTMKGWTELSPEAERFYQSLLSGELADEARAGKGPQAREEGPREAREGKTQTDTEGEGTAQGSRFFEDAGLDEAFNRQVDELNRASRERALELLNDPDIPLESKAQAVFDEAGKALLQTIGEQGAASLDQAEETTTRLDNLSIARQMETAGKNAKAARLATGWERGADGKWRYEIPDIKVNSNFDETAALAAKNQESYYTNLGQIVEGKPELFAAYPELKNMQVYFDPAGRLNGRYSGHITIEVPPFRADSTLWAMESLLIHEIQHAIQEIEGFASGGNKGQFIQQNSKQPILDGIEKARLKAFNEIPENLKEAARKVNRNEDTDGLALDQIQADPAAKAAWADYIRALANAAEIAGIPGEQFDGLSPEEQYRRLAGEVEARNAEARIGFTPRQRLETLLEETEDVAREDQIFLARGVRMGAALTMRKEDTGKTARVVDIDPDIIVDENGQAIDIKNTRDLTKWILDQYMPINEKGEREGIEVKIADDEVIQKFTSSGLKASLKSKNRKQRPFYADLIKIIENAVFDHFELSDSRHEKGLQGQNVYYSAAKINKDFYSIRIKIDVSKYDKIKPAYKDHKVAEIKIEPSLYRGYETTQTEGPEIAPSLYTGQPNVTRQDEDAITDISLSVLKGEVKPSRIEGTTLFQTSPQTELDDNYFKALESGDMETAQRMVDAQARKNGYISTDEYRISHRAPNSHSDDGFFPNLTNVRESGIVPDNYWTIPRYYLYGENDYKAFNIVMSALNSPNQKITMYRAIPKNTKEAAFRNGDWITPLYEIADAEGATTNAPYRIISQEVFLSDVWWDGDTITAFGYDDGKDYVYKNTKNNRKLNDVIVRDYEGNIVPPSKRFNYRAYEIFFQTGDRDMVEEAAEFEDGKGYRGYIEAYYELPQEVEGFSDEQIDAWFDEFVERAKQAVNAGEQGSEAAAGNGLTPADVDREFNELIGEPGKLDEFVKMLADTHNHDYGRWQAVDEEDEAERGRQMEITDTLRRRLTHPTWQSIFKANGEMGPTQRKQLLTLIRKAPRDYRAIYADVMEQPEFAVSAEDTAAAALKYRITDSRRQDLDSLSPEKLRQLAEQWDIEDFAEKVQTGKAQFNEPVEKAYIQQLQKQRKEVEQALKEVETDRKEDNEYLERIAGKQFMDTLDRAVKAREEITRNNEKLDRAIANNQKNAAFYTRRAQRAAANYNSIVQTLDDLAKARDLELDVREVLEDQRIHDAVQAAKKELRTEAREKRDALKDEFTKIRARERTKASLQKKFAVIMAVNDLKAYQRELKERQDAAKELTRAKSAVFKRILRPLNPRVINADQGRAVAIIQRFAEPSMLEGIDRFIGSVEKPYLRAVFKTWKVDEASREKILEGKKQRSREKIISLLDKESFDHLTNADKKYLYRRLANDWIKELGLESIIERRNENYPGIGEDEHQIALKYLPFDMYYRIIEKPFSEWTLEEGEELAKIIDDLTIQGKEIYKANIDAQKKRIREYQEAVVKTIRTVNGRGLQKNLNDTPEEKRRKITETEKILNKYDAGAGGTAQDQARRRALKGTILGYADMNEYRFARMLDNGDPNGKNTAALYRRASDAYNLKMAAIDARTERILEAMKENKISESELWNIAVEIDLGGEMGKRQFTNAELIGFMSASRDTYSRDAAMYGTLLLEKERAPYQREGLTGAELAPLYNLAEGRFDQVMKAATKLLEDKPEYRKFMEVIDEDFAETGLRLGESITRYNNTYMPIVENYFPINRQEPVSVRSADTQYSKDLMGSSNGAFNLFVDKGFSLARIEIPAQYQTAINLDILGVWSESVNKEEHFMAYGQLVKDLNAIYKQNRQVKDAIQRRYGRDAIDYINRYINELANPNAERVRSSLDKAIRAMRGNTAAAYLAWKTSSIVKQFITSPAPFFAYLDLAEYWGTFIEFSTHQGDAWSEITSLSEFMKHRSANLLTDLVKERAKQRFENKADAAISGINEKGMEGLEWIDRMCVAPGWLALYRKEYARLTRSTEGVTYTEIDAKMKAAQYADDITKLVQPSQNVAPLFKGNTELGRAVLQFTASLNVIWQNIRYDLPWMIRNRRYKNAAGTIIGYAIAGILLGAITAGFDDDDDELTRAKKLVWWSTTQFTDAFPIIGSEATHLAELALTGKTRYQSGLNLVPAFQKGWSAAGTGIKSVREGDFTKLIKAAATAAEGAAIFKGLPVSGIKEGAELLGIGDGDGEPGFNPEALLGRR